MRFKYIFSNSSYSTLNPSLLFSSETYCSWAAASILMEQLVYWLVFQSALFVLHPYMASSPPWFDLLVSNSNWELMARSLVMEIGPVLGRMRLLLLLSLCPGHSFDPGIEKYSDFGFRNICSPLWRVTVPRDTCCRWLGLSLVGDLPLVRRSVDLAFGDRSLSFSLLLFGRSFRHLQRSYLQFVVSLSLRSHSAPFLQLACFGSLLQLLISSVSFHLLVLA